MHTEDIIQSGLEVIGCNSVVKKTEKGKNTELFFAGLGGLGYGAGGYGYK